MTFDTLSEFQNFLISRKLILEKHATFYAYWVSQFLYFSNKHSQLNIDLKIQSFLNNLQKSKNDWQVRQADRAIQLYLYNFCNKKTLSHLGIEPGTYPRSIDPPGIIRKMREIIRLKHYAYSTERTYINRVKDFFNYIEQIPEGKLPVEKLTSQDAKNYLSHLAIKHRVSASTQNQAFNALLFLFRNILHIELAGMSTTLRAKRGQKLPAVLSVGWPCL